MSMQKMPRGIHYVQYRYRPTHKGVWPSDATMARFHNKWRVYRDGHMITPRYGVWYYDTKADAMQAVADMEAARTRPRSPTPEPTQTTRCLNCGAVLTDADGVRRLGAHYDSRLPSFPIFGGGLYQNVVWARCDACYMAARPGLRAAEPSGRPWKWVEELEGDVIPVTLPDGTEGRMCPRVHPTKFYACCLLADHRGPHLAEFNASSETIRWAD